MYVLVINSGSSTIRFRLYHMEQETLLVSGKVERIGETAGSCVYRRHAPAGDVAEQQENLFIANHATGVEHILARLESDAIPGSIAALNAVGHRVVHGGELFRKPVRIDQAVIDGIREMIPLAPLHNPANLAGIETMARLYPQLPQAAVFDTAFFQTLPPHAFHYALPYDLCRRHHVRRYGFHGISHQYVARQAADFLQQALPSLRLITLHLGNGASAAAIVNGNCIDTSMGMTPLAGLIMGTRCGDVDPAVPFYLARQLGMEPAAIEALMNHDSGMKGLCGYSDMRDIHRLAEGGDEAAGLAIDMYCYRIANYCGAYYTALGGLDVLVFTAGIGENDPLIRQAICQRLAVLGVSLDQKRNRASAGGIIVISNADSRVKILVIPTNEELEIARQTLSAINNTESTS